MSKLGLFGVVTAAVFAVACGGASPKVEGSGVSQARTGKGASCERRQPGVGAARADTVRQGSTVALARAGEATVAYVADADAHAVRTIDLDHAKQIANTPLAGEPAQILVLADGRVAATLRDKNAVEVLEPAANPAAPLASLCTVDVPVEPFGLAASPDDGRVLVTSVWDRRLTALDQKTMKASFDVKLPREPRAVLVDDDGQRAFVAHVVGGKMSVVDLTSDKHDLREVDLRVKRLAPSPSRRGTDNELRSSCQGFALAKAIDAPDAQKERPQVQDTPTNIGERPRVSGKAPKDPAPAKPKGRVFAPMVTVDPGDPNQRSAAYYGDVFDGVAKEAPIVSVIDAEAERTLTRNVMTLGNKSVEECVLPRSAAVRGSTGTLFVTCFGIDTMVELDTRGLDPARLERRRWKLGAGPTGVAIDDRASRAVVWSQFDGSVGIVDLKASADKPTTTTVAIQGAMRDTPIARGRRLFHSTDDKRISSDGSACASCHPDGREDALTWATPDGPRQTIMLAGRVEGSAPYGWMGRHDTLPNYVNNTFSRLGGTGLKDRDLDDLVAYLREMPGPTLRDEGPSDHGRLAEHGRDLFFGEQQGCATCHVGATATDGSHHDVSSKATADVVTEFDTPTLRFVSGSAPYFHDGRYKTLDDVLSANDHAMGYTARLSRRDTLALKAYLETL